MRKRESLEAIERHTTGNCDWQLLAETSHSPVTDSGNTCSL